MVIFITSLVHCMASLTVIICHLVVFLKTFFTAGPRLTMNCLTDHRTWYNLQVCSCYNVFFISTYCLYILKAFAKHVHGVDWEYHHCLGLINRTSFLLNYLSDVIDGAQSYADWINGDLYECTEECFGICTIPGIFHLRYPRFSTIT